ncbi:MAG: NAD(P)H:quinone oxidoreductase [Pseudomonadota bacterium]
MTEILVLFYSRGGKTLALAEEIRLGISQVPGCSAKLRTVKPLEGDADPQIPIVHKEDLRDCDGLALGSPTRFGNMAAPLKAFLDSTTDLWMSAALVDKPATVFTATGSLHGGQESTLLSMMLPLMHHGMVIVGVPYSTPKLMDTNAGGTPYGASHWSGHDNQRALSEEELSIARAAGARLARIAERLAKA